MEQTVKLQTIVHGSCVQFTEFDQHWIGSNSGQNHAPGFYFFDDLDSAAYYAFNHCKGSVDPLIYVCRFRSDANILLRGQPIAFHSAAVQQRWKQLPGKHEALFQSANWYDALYRAAEDSLNSKLALNQVARMLKGSGFDAIYNMPVNQAHPAISSTEILVMNPRAIEIIMILDARTRQTIEFQTSEYFAG